MKLIRTKKEVNDIIKRILQSYENNLEAEEATGESAIDLTMKQYKDFHEWLQKDVIKAMDNGNI